MEQAVGNSSNIYNTYGPAALRQKYIENQKNRTHSLEKAKNGNIEEEDDEHLFDFEEGFSVFSNDEDDFSEDEDELRELGELASSEDRDTNLLARTEEGGAPQAFSLCLRVLACALYEAEKQSRQKKSGWK